MMSTTPFTLQYQPTSITSSRVVTKISSYRVDTTSRRGIKQLGISFGSIFLLFSNKSSRGPLCQQPGKIPSPRLLMTTLLKRLLESKIIHASGSYMNLCHLHVTYQCTSKHSGEGRGGEGRGGERLARKRYISTGAGLVCRNDFRTDCTDTWYLVNTWSELFKRSIKLSSEYWAQLFKSCMDSTIHWKTL